MSQLTNDSTAKNAMIILAWIAHSRRSQLFAEAFAVPLYRIQFLKRHYALAPIRYFLQALKTLQILIAERPSVVLIQNPPIFAPLVVYFYSLLFNTEFIIDSHTGALLASWWQWSIPLHAYLSRKALATIVTNEHLASLVESWGANSLIVPDIPIKFPEGNVPHLKSAFSVAVINTFSPDEPVAEVLDVARKQPDVQFYITGDPIRADRLLIASSPENVVFTGFLPDPDYIGLLRAVDAIMVLTTDDHTMQRGACEAMALGKPIITSDWPLLRSFFSKGTIHVDNTSEDINEGVEDIRTRNEELQLEMLALREEHRREWEEQQTSLIELVSLHTSLEQNS